MRKKKILFVGISLKVGGIERALVEQINSLDFRKYEVDLFLYYHGGAYFKEISPYVNILKSSNILEIIGRTHDEAKSNKIIFIVRSIMAVLARYMGTPILYKLILRTISFNKQYDYAISYFQNGSLKSLYYGCNQIVLKKVRASKKIAWIHSDYIVGKLFNHHNNNEYNQFDAVVNVTKVMKYKFDSLNIISPAKSYCVYNRCDIKSILNKATLANFSIRNKFRIVTIGRLEKDKGTDRLLNLALELKNKDLSFSWDFIGSGILDNWSKSFVLKNNLEDYVYFHGKQQNVYPFIKYAHLLVSGSISETFGLSIYEALVLNTPVVAYKYEAISELIDNSNSCVCNDYKEIGIKIQELIINDKLYSNLKQNTKPLKNYNQINERQFDFILKTI